MTDLELTRKCAEKMGLTIADNDGDFPGRVFFIKNVGELLYEFINYDPLHDDAQAMALVVKFRLRVLPQANGYWCADNGDPTPFVCGGYFLGQGDTPNRAIVECVAKLEG